MAKLDVGVCGYVRGNERMGVFIVVGGAEVGI